MGIFQTVVKENNTNFTQANFTSRSRILSKSMTMCTPVSNCFNMVEGSQQEGQVYKIGTVIYFKYLSMEGVIYRVSLRRMIELGFTSTRAWSVILASEM